VSNVSDLPTGVTLQHIDGGSNYYASHGLTYAASAGWDNPSFIPIGPWDDSIANQAAANRFHDLGWNTAFAVVNGNSSTPTLARSNSISLVQLVGNVLPGTGSETVGLWSKDEPMYYSQVTTPIATTPNSVQDGRFWWLNTTTAFAFYNGLGGSPSNPAQVSAANVLYTPVATPDGATRHIDVSSVDEYFFAGAKENSGMILNAAGLLYHQAPTTPDQAARGSNYGTLIDRERAATGGSTPLYAYVEDGGPYVGDTSASDYITPPELNWATWSSLIHGARGISYFNHSFAGPGYSFDNMSSPYYSTVQPGQIVSMYAQVKATDALVEQMAPVLNSPTALNYVTTNTPGYQNGQTLSAFSGIEVTAKDDNGQFYIFADTRDSETQTNINTTFTIADKNATSVTVIGENRSIAVNNGVFSDSFATGATVHIYEVNEGPGTPTSPTFASGAVVVSSTTGPGAGTLTLSTNANGVTVNTGLSNLTVTSGTQTLKFPFHPSETIDATSRTNDTFLFSKGFGNETIVGFSPPSGDVLELRLGAFGYLNWSMSAAQDLAAVLLHTTMSAGNTIISDSYGDALTLTSVNITALSDPTAVKFV